ncbi:hypothetical protein BDBG_09524 [Blastomyces gilchristii SLH14081]|uniref:Phospholipase/carboxylesterase/thioesterase domain-containing protein n=1 Tax=Blastomyces gilchristii (strain SLH14081) TaxID=559298 RepID=A0A179V2I1_BLAGS|nr:uncharacterized protein BDBG_09524 [Blastomyces gilchristii SLH14081]OAT14516.1 hypothetical protein BDBG_09524 [Blastomyces gilchristii SLH14081]
MTKSDPLSPPLPHSISTSASTPLSTPPPTSTTTITTPPFPKPTIIPPRGPHTHTLILLHGRGGNSLDFSSALMTSPMEPPTSTNPDRSSLSQRFPGVKFVFPDARIGRSTASGKVMMPQWFDVVTLRPVYEREWELSRDGLRASVGYLMELVKEEGRILGGVGRVIVGGFSQGGVVALGAAVAFDAEADGGGEALGGCVAMSPWLPFQRDLIRLVGSEGEKDTGTAVVGEEEEEDKDRAPEPDPSLAVKAKTWFRENILGIPPPPVATDPQPQSQSSASPPKTPIWIAHGALDEHVLPQFGEDAAKTLEALGWNVTFMLYDDLSHWIMRDELADLAIFLNVVAGVPDEE